TSNVLWCFETVGHVALVSADDPFDQRAILKIYGRHVRAGPDVVEDARYPSDPNSKSARFCAAVFSERRIRRTLEIWDSVWFRNSLKSATGEFLNHYTGRSCLLGSFAIDLVITSCRRALSARR